MALTGTLVTTSSHNRSLTFSWTATQSSSTNKSTISWQLTGSGSASGYIVCGPITVTLNGDTIVNKPNRYNIYNGTTIATGTKTVTHATNGSGSFSVDINAAIYSYSNNCSASRTFTLDTINRPSTVSCATGYITEAVKISINRYNNSFKHTLTFSYGSLSNQSIASNVQAASYNWSLPSSLYAQTPNKSGKGTITCKTYTSANVLVGTTTCEFTAKVKESLANPTASPTVTVTDSLTTTLTGVTNKVITGVSAAAITFGATARHSASITSKKVSCGSLSRTSDGNLSAVPSGVFNFQITDSRGFTIMPSVTLNEVAYIPLTCNVKATNPTATGDCTVTISGNYFDGSFGAQSNTLALTLYQRAEGSETFEEVTFSETVELEDGKYSVEIQVTGLDYTKTYYYKCDATDKIASLTSKTISVRSLPIFDWSAENFQFNVPTIMLNGIGAWANAPGSGTSYDDWQTPGYYYFTSSTVPTGGISGMGVSGWLIIERYGSIIKQTWRRSATTASNAVREFSRQYYNGAWLNWVEVNLYTPKLIYEKNAGLEIAGTIVSGASDSGGLVPMGATNGTVADDEWNITGADFSQYKRLRIVWLRDQSNTADVSEFFLPLEYSVSGHESTPKKYYINTGSAYCFGDRNRVNVCPVAVDSTKTKLALCQCYSLYGTAATTVSQIRVAKIEGYYY